MAILQKRLLIFCVTMNDVGKRFAYNIIWLFAAEFISLVLLTIGSILLIRQWGDVVYGQLAFATSSVALFGFLMDYGLTTIFVQEVAQDPRRLHAYLRNMLTLKVVLMILTSAVFVGYLAWLHKPPALQALTWAWLLQAFVVSGTTFLYSVFRVREVMRYEAIAKIAFNILTLAAMLMVVWRGWLPQQYAFLLIAIAVAYMIGTYVLVTRQVGFFLPQINWRLWRKFLRKGAPLSLSVAFISIYFSIDSVMLSQWKGDAVVGWYNASYRLVLILLTFLGLYYTALFPILARLVGQGAAALTQINRVTLKIMATFVLPLVVAISCLARPTLLFLFHNPAFAQGTVALQVLIWAVAISSVSMLLSNTLLAVGRRGWYAFGTGGGAVLNVVLNLWLIPRYSLAGAAAATVAAETVIILLFGIMYRRMIGAFPKVSGIGKPMLVLVLMTPLWWWLPRASMPVLVSYIIAALVYFAMLLLVRGITKEDFHFVKRLFFST